MSYDNLSSVSQNVLKTSCYHLLLSFLVVFLLFPFQLNLMSYIYWRTCLELVYVSGFLSVSHLPGCKRLDLLYLLGLKVSALVFFDKIFPKFEAQF